jgi:glycyl-tRNA synthetase beta chain
MPDLLIELLSEEIPARMQPRAAEDLRRLVTDGLVERGLTYAAAAAFVTPRRLTLTLTDLAPRSAELREERRGPRTDAPEAAIEGFLRSAGLARDQLEIREDKKAQVYFAVVVRPGRPAAEIVAETLEAVIRGFPWPKSMRWGEGSLRWVRPLQSIVAILTTDAGHEVVPLDIDGIAAGDLTVGHRFMSPAPLAVASFEDYAGKLRRAHVLLDPAERADKIAHDAAQLAFAQGLEVVDDPALLAEIAGLVEWPVVLMGRIEERFLDLPPEVLRVSMKTHQKFLSVRDPASGRIEAYIVVANRETADHGAAILAGNARVLAARLSDAAFFWENDLATPLDEMASKLAAVTFHNKLGSQADRIERIAALAREIAPMVGADRALADRAARLAKADLASAMVYEFPELQGAMGRRYAERAGEDPAVAAACAEHYAPLGPSDDVPSAPVSVAVALADKLDTLTGFWAIDEKPTGSKDPFALRRAALGAIRLITGNQLEIGLEGVLIQKVSDHLDALKQPAYTESDEKDKAAAERAGMPLPDFIRDRMFREGRGKGYKPGAEIFDFSRVEEPSLSNPELIASNLIGFLQGRLKVYLLDQGTHHDVIDACFPLPGNDNFTLVVSRAHALQAFLATEDGANLLAGYKRAVNILTQEEKKDGVDYALDADPRLAETEAERALFAALDAAEAALGPALAAEDFAGALRALARLRAPIDAFFDTTTVNADSPLLRRNRLCLLHRIRAVMNRVAIFSALDSG